MEFERRRQRNGRIDIAPLVDIVFNLLLFFVITYNIAADAAIRLRLPESTTAESRAEELIVISLTREGEIFIGEQLVSMEELPAAVQAALSLQSEPSVKIRADQEAAVGLLIKVVDGVRLSGCTNLNIVTQKP
jgi:biopolymer transport protein ExbD